jgi:hypothetical protein
MIPGNDTRKSGDPTGRCENIIKIYLIKKRDLSGVNLFQDSAGLFYINELPEILLTKYANNPQGFSYMESVISITLRSSKKCR